MSSVLVTVIGPERRTDLALPDQTPIAELIPELVSLCVDRRGLDPTARWAIGPEAGGAFPPDRTLAEIGVLDGALLRLRTLAAVPEPAASPASRQIATGESWPQARLDRVTRLTEDFLDALGRLLAGRDADLSFASPGVAAQLRAMVAPFLASGDRMYADFADLTLTINSDPDPSAAIEAAATFLDRSIRTTRRGDTIPARPRQVALRLRLDPAARCIISATVTPDDSQPG